MAGLEGLRLTGLGAGVQALDQVRNAAGQFTGPMLRVGSDLIYAWGIETGFRKGGGSARRAGPAYYLRGAMLRVEPRLIQIISPALELHATADVAQVMRQAGEALVTQARQIVPVRSGRLRESIRTVPH